MASHIALTAHMDPTAQAETSITVQRTITVKIAGTVAIGTPGAFKKTPHKHLSEQGVVLVTTLMEATALSIQQDTTTGQMVMVFTTLLIVATAAKPTTAPQARLLPLPILI